MRLGAGGYETRSRRVKPEAPEGKVDTPEGVKLESPLIRLVIDD